jgi:Fur family peroxide stress response transcriptional regulator
MLIKGQNKDELGVMYSMSEHSGKVNLKDKMEAFQVKCRGAGLRITPQRIAVFKALVESKEHPSAEMLHRKMRNIFPSISLDTVNRTLLTLVEIGAAFVVEGSGEPKRFDGGLKNHQHFKCVKCRRIIDLFVYGKVKLIFLLSGKER